MKHDAEYKTITKTVKKRNKHLRNEKLRQQTDEINENANQRQVEELYKNMKDGKTKLKTIRAKQLCDPNKLKVLFKAHFNTCSNAANPIELKDAPSFNRKLQDVKNTDLNTTPPNIKVLTDQQSNH